MKTAASLPLVILLFAVGSVLAQTTACPADLAATEDCADVINPNACYNEFGFRDKQTLSCIEGKNDADRARKVCLSQ